MKKRVAIYCRSDSPSASESARLAAEFQQERLVQFAKKHHYEIVSIYSDIGYAGHDLTRPEFLRLCSDAEKQLFDEILVTKYGRLYRGWAGNFQKLPVPILAVNERPTMAPQRWPSR